MSLKIIWRPVLEFYEESYKRSVSFLNQVNGLPAWQIVHREYMAQVGLHVQTSQMYLQETWPKSIQSQSIFNFEANTILTG